MDRARWNLPCPPPRRFPSEHFGKLFGLVMALSAAVSLLQFPLFTLIKGPLQDDPLYVSPAGEDPGLRLRLR